MTKEENKIVKEVATKLFHLVVNNPSVEAGICLIGEDLPTYCNEYL